MTPDEIKARLVDIEASGGDPEHAHSEEDRLHVDVLLAIQRGECDDPALCAGLAATTINMQFARWYA